MSLPSRIAAACLCAAACAESGTGPPAVAVPSATAAPQLPPAGTEAAAGAATPTAHVGQLTLRGTLHVVREDPPNAKSFHGVTLDAHDGKTWIVSYTLDPLLLPFDGVEITMQGEKYGPPGQALVGPHVRPVRWEVVDWKKAGDLERVEPEQELEGSFDLQTFPSGTKLDGSSMRVFRAANGTQYFLAKAPSPEPARGARVRIRARVVEPTRLEQRVGGPYLWVLEVLR